MQREVGVRIRLLGVKYKDANKDQILAKLQEIMKLCDPADTTSPQGPKSIVIQPDSAYYFG